MKYLIDTSALVRVLRRQVDVGWHEQIARGLVAICEPVITETVTAARATEYRRVLAGLHDAYPWVAVPDNAWNTIREIRGRLADRSAHQGLSVADYLVVATALHHRQTILHEDADFVTASSVVAELQERRISEHVG
jgi:predicted nucleic acid-binding protein